MKRIVVAAAFILLLWGLLLRLGVSAPAEPTGAPLTSATAPGPDAQVPTVTWTHILDVAAGEAYQGPWRMNDSDFRYVDAPTVAMDADGAPAVAWVDQSRRAVLFQRFDAEGEPILSGPVAVSGSPDVFSWLPRVALDRSDPDAVYLLWQEIVFSGGSHGGEIFFARSDDGGRTFTPPANLSNTPAGAGKGRLDRWSWHNGSLDLAQGPDGVLHAAWTEYEGPLRVSRSEDGGRSWQDPVQVAGDGLPARGPSLAVAPGGAVWVAWTVGEVPSSDIHVSRSTDGGRTFSPAETVGAGPGHADAPSLAVDADGNVHLAYAEAPGGSGSDYGIRYLRLPTGAEAFEAPRELDPPGSHRDRGGGFPALALDGEGNPWVLWDLFDDPRERPLGLALAGSADGGDTFSTGALVPGTADRELGFSGSLQGLFMNKLGLSPGGRMAVVHGTFDPGNRSRIRLHLGRVNLPGSPARPPGILPGPGSR